MLKNEIEVMKMLAHPNIVRLYETLHDESNQVMHLVMELWERGDLLNPSTVIVILGFTSIEKKTPDHRPLARVGLV